MRSVPFFTVLPPILRCVCVCACCILLQVQHALEKTQFTLEREIARRARMEKKMVELEGRGPVSPRLTSSRNWQSKTPSRKPQGSDTTTTVQPSLRRSSSARSVFNLHGGKGLLLTARFGQIMFSFRNQRKREADTEQIKNLYIIHEGLEKYLKHSLATILKFQGGDAKTC